MRSCCGKCWDRFNFFAGRPCIFIAGALCVGTPAALPDWHHSNEWAGWVFNTVLVPQYAANIQVLVGLSNSALNPLFALLFLHTIFCHNSHTNFVQQSAGCLKVWKHGLNFSFKLSFLHSSHNYSGHFVVCNQVKHHECLRGETVQNCVSLSPELLERGHRSSVMQLGGGYDSIRYSIVAFFFFSLDVIGRQVQTNLFQVFWTLYYSCECTVCYHTSDRT